MLDLIKSELLSVFDFDSFKFENSTDSIKTLSFDSDAFTFDITASIYSLGVYTSDPQETIEPTYNVHEIEVWDADGVVKLSYEQEQELIKLIES